jgi:hypothetical protein
MFMSDWRRCRRRVCRRRRACVPVGIMCHSPAKPTRELTPDQEASAMVQTKRALERRLGAPRGR